MKYLNYFNENLEISGFEKVSEHDYVNFLNIHTLDNNFTEEEHNIIDSLRSSNVNYFKSVSKYAESIEVELGQKNSYPGTGISSGHWRSIGKKMIITISKFKDEWYSVVLMAPLSLDFDEFYVCDQKDGLKKVMNIIKNKSLKLYKPNTMDKIISFFGFKK